MWATNLVGKRLGFDEPDQLDVEIVGLVRDAAYSSVKGQFPAQLMCRPDSAGGPASVRFTCAASCRPRRYSPPVPRIVARVDANLPVIEARTLESQVRRTVPARIGCS